MTVDIVRVRESGDTVDVGSLLDGASPVRRGGESEAHVWVKDAVARYLFEHGFRAVATEVPLRAGTIDVVGVQARLFATHARFWLGSAPRAGLEMVSILVEVKVERADFLRDLRSWSPGFDVQAHLELGYGRDRGAGKMQRVRGSGDGNLRCLAAPVGLVRRSEVPEGWGLLEVSGSGEISRAVRGLFHEDGHVDRIAVAVAETLTRNVFLAETREARRAEAANFRWMQCVGCRHWTGPTRRPAGTKPYDHRGLCEALSARWPGDDRMVRARRHVGEPLPCHKLGFVRFEPRTEPS